MIANPVPRLFVTFTPPEGSESPALRYPVVAFDDQGFALVVCTQSAVGPQDVMGLVPVSALLASMGQGWVAWMAQDPAPVVEPQSGTRVVGIVPGSSAPVEYKTSDGMTGVGIVSAWGVKEDGSMIALGVTERLTEVRRVVREADGSIVATYDDFDGGQSA